MKKLFSVLLALCLLCTAAALAEATPTLDDMPAVVIEDDNTTVELSAFNGIWDLDLAFVGDTYVNLETLATTYGMTFSPIRIEDGSLFYYEDNGEGGVVERGIACAFEAGQLQGEDDGISFCFDTLVNGNIVMSYFLQGEGDEVICVSLFLVHPAE